MSTTYLAGSVLAQLDQAQAGIDRHVAAGTDGRCLDCGQDHPCPGLRAAGQTFARYGHLPARRPGLASRGLARTGGFGWFQAFEFEFYRAMHYLTGALWAAGLADQAVEALLVISTGPPSMPSATPSRSEPGATAVRLVPPILHQESGCR